jgi:hypothetical protein
VLQERRVLTRVLPQGPAGRRPAAILSSKAGNARFGPFGCGEAVVSQALPKDSSADAIIGGAGGVPSESVERPAARARSGRVALAESSRGIRSGMAGRSARGDLSGGRSEGTSRLRSGSSAPHSTARSANPQRASA